MDGESVETAVLVKVFETCRERPRQRRSTGEGVRERNGESSTILW